MEQNLQFSRPGGNMRSLFTDIHSVWQKVQGPDFHPLGHDIEVDVCVIGAGIAGLTTAYLLLKEGKSVIVIDREARLGLHETGLTSAQLSNAFDDRYFEVQRIHGNEGARLIAESHTEAINEIENIIKAENIDCDFQRLSGYLFCGPEHDLEYLKKEIQATREAGLQDVELLSRAPTHLFDTGECIHFPNQGQFHPVKYIAGLAKAILKAGGHIYTETQASEVKSGDTCVVKTDTDREIICKSVVAATNVPFLDRVVMHTKQAPYRTYIVCVELPKGSMQPMHIWDTSDPYHYIRLIQDPSWKSDILLVGGEDHRVGQEEDPESRYANIKNWIRDRLDIEPLMVSQWSGQVIEPFDYVAYIGKNPGDKNVYIITGDSGQGLTHSTIGGMIIRDLIMGRENAWAKLYDPSRKSLKAISEYMRENMKSTAPYRDWLSAGDVDAIEKIPLGEGAIVRDGVKKLAVYRDQYGHPSIFSAKCPHLGCVVRWNSSEKTWDCPCHGSRFHCQGEVINGPAPRGLDRFEERHEAPGRETVPSLAQDMTPS
jgi:glycine/D-amino acid oxidase-like deaminating enzyme/nitrite reductase/ring-hydroxylating ferredoxin subunit